MMNIIRRKPSSNDQLGAKGPQRNAPISSALPASIDVSGIATTRTPANARPANALPDLRLSGFDIDKVMGQAGLGSPSPLGTTDDEDYGVNYYRDYITSKSVTSSKKRTSHLPSPPSYQPPVRSPSVAPTTVSIPSHDGRHRHPQQQQQQPRGQQQILRAASTPQLRQSRDSKLPPSPLPAATHADRSGYHKTNVSSRRSAVGSSDGVGVPPATRYAPRSEHSAHSAKHSPPSSSHSSSRVSSAAAASGAVRPPAPPHRSRSERLPPAPPGSGLMSKIGRALKMESEEEKSAREWEEARERQNQHDRHERNKHKAVQAIEEAKRKKAEEDDMRRRKAGAERVERERKQREAEADRLRREEAMRKEEILRKHEDERRKKAAEARAEIDRQIAEKRRAEEAEIARKRQAEAAEKARLKAIDDAEKARIKAIEDEKRAVEEAKERYHQAVAQAHASVEREDREHVVRSRQTAEAKLRWMKERAAVPSDADGSREHPASDSGVSLQSTDPSLQQGHPVGVASPEQSPSLNPGRATMQRAPTDDVPSRPLRPERAPPSIPEQPSDATKPFQVPGSIQRAEGQDVKTHMQSPSVEARRPQQGRTVQFQDSPDRETVHLPRDRVPALRFASALSIGARSSSPTGRSPLVLEPAVRAPWDAFALPSSQSTPHYLAQVAYQAALADTSDPTKPVQGEGWRSHGFGRSDLIPSHYRVIEVPDVRLEKRRVGGSADSASSQSEPDADDAESTYEEVWEEYTQEILHFDLFERVFTRTTPEVLERLVAHLDCSDVKALRQSCKEVRFALDHLEGREIVLRRFLEPVGYRTWKLSAHKVGMADKDPLPFTFSDVEAFVLSSEVYAEYPQVSVNWLRCPHEMDARVPRLARASTRAYSRLLSRLRLQPDYSPPTTASTMSPPMASLRSPSLLQSPSNSSSGAVSPVSPSIQSASFDTGAVGRRLQRVGGMSALSPGGPSAAGSGNVASPWKPGRAALFRVWVPTRNSIWQSDDEVVRCERELFLAGVWSFLQRGDIVWNVAMGDENNVGRMIFDGQYLRDLTYRFDKAGHLPPWQNMFLHSPGYYHNIIRSSTANPVIYLDILPWREQIVSSLRLVQDQVETANASGGRYRIAKWLYRAVAHIKVGQIISDEGLVVADEGWAGRIVFETEGTSEHAKDFVARCAGPMASPQAKAQLMAAVLGGSSDAAVNASPRGRAQDHSLSALRNPAVKDASGRRVDAHTPFAVLRERSRPGLIWLRPVMPRESLQ
ncbi:unnamed protein product [Parajaminaea phylloscopi]